MIKRIPQPIKEKILLNNPELPKQEKLSLALYGAVHNEYLPIILDNIPELTAEEEKLIRQYSYPQNTRLKIEAPTMTLQELIDCLTIKLSELDEPANTPQEFGDANEEGNTRPPHA